MIFRDGILCDVHVRYWTGSKKLTAQDLGLSEAEISEAFKLGRKELIPSEVMKNFWRLESRAREVVEKNSFDFPIGHARFIPKRRANRVFTKLEAIRREWNSAVDALIESLPTYKEEMRKVFTVAAENAYVKQFPAQIQEFSIDESEKERFIESYLARIDSLYPDPQSLRAKFGMDWDVYTIALDAERTESSKLLSALAQEESKTLKEMSHKAEEEVKRRLDIESYKIKTQEKVGKFVDDVVMALRQQTTELCKAVIANIRDGKVVTNKTLNRLRDFIERFRDMNFVGDTKVEEQLSNLKKEFLDVFEINQIREDTTLQEDFTRRLKVIADTAADINDIARISSEYSRRILWRANGVENNVQA